MRKIESKESMDIRATGQLPAPLVPAEVNLSTFPWSPVRPDFFLDHPLALAQHAEPFRAFVLLAMHAWRKLPAMTVPDDDIQLAAMAGFARDVPAWLSVRDEVMRDWVLCSDGRWHHPELAKWALQSWEAKKDKERHSAQQSARARSRKQAASPNADDEPVDESPGSAAAQPYKRGQETENTVDGQNNIADGQNNERERTLPSNVLQLPSSSTASSLSVSATGPVTKEDNQQVSEVDPVVQIFDHWKQQTNRPDEKLTASRRKIIQARLDEGVSSAQICLAINAAAESDFYQGRTPKQAQRIDTLDVICKDRDRILRLASEASAKRHPSGLKPAARKTAESLIALLINRRAAVIDVDQPSVPATEGDAS